ncbi:MAG: oligosaccharide flippase family protein [Spirochaetales bacterium]|nr:oligosaccharide flippase family protein [Spirochaetales bacterium]
MGNYSLEENHSRKAIKAASYVVLGYGTSLAIRLGSNILLTRLLVPDYFGIVAIANVIYLGLFLFSDIGTAQAIIRHEDSDNPDFINTAWTIQVIRGLGLFVLTALLAYPISRIYGEKTLLYIIPTIGLNAISHGFLSTSIVTLSKELKQGTITYIELVIQLLSALVMISLAYFFPNVWALVIGGIVGTLVKTIWSHRLKGHVKNRFLINRKYLADLLSFGKWILVSTAMMFLATQIDRLMLGKLFTFSFFGIYNIAVMIAELPKQVIAKISDSVLYPLITKYATMPREEIRKKIWTQRNIMLYPLAFMVATLTSFGDYLILFLYDDRYAAAAWILPVIALGIWPLILYSTIDRVLFTLGKPKYYAFGNVSKLIYMLISLPLFYHLWGAIGAVIAVALNDIPIYILINIGLTKEKLALKRQDLSATLVLLALLALFIYIRNMFGLGLPGRSVYFVSQ